MSAINYNINETSQPIVNTVNNILPKIPIAIIVLIFGILLIKLLMHLIRAGLSVTKFPKGLQEVIAGLSDVALWVFLTIALLQFVGLNNIALALTGSFAFIILGLSQGGAAAIADVIAGLTLGRDRDFSVGDYVKITDRTEGVIEELDLRRTRLRDKDGRMHVISNSSIDKTGWILIERGKTFSSPKRSLTIRKRKKS